MYIIGRPINGITINPLEYILESAGESAEIMQFATKEKAVSFIEKHVATFEQFEGVIAEAHEIKCPQCTRSHIERVDYPFQCPHCGNKEEQEHG